ncbi:hypothetical protein [Fusibacter ferrireducens]|uniref:Uncharacterized protein n=1 Tax=Fusibacter ferrireducens TaxID=2785058 RepID=A0ABR9ZUM5_9FIRM|nr:hypothetical protein [Fusibacter ferrireducens]MBF4694168.1 hypothetical protein [Fusibacter ferrireducens]
MAEKMKQKFIGFWQHNLGLKILMMGIIIGLVAVMWILSDLKQEIMALNSEMGYIKDNIVSIDSNFNTQSQSFLNQLSGTLDSESSLIASYDVTAETYKTENNQLPLLIKIIPKADYADLSIEIRAIGKKTYIQTAIANEGIYTAKMPIDITEDDIKFMVKFTHNGGVNNEALDVYPDIIQSYLMRTDAEGDLSFSKQGTQLQISGKVTSIYDPKYAYNRNNNSDVLKCYPVSGQVMIKVNGEAVRNTSISIDTSLNDGVYSNCHIFTQINEVLENFKAQDRIEVVSELIDNYGNAYTHVTNVYPE